MSLLSVNPRYAFGKGPSIGHTVYRELNNKIEEMLKVSQSHQRLAIIGGSGVGKSRLIQTICERHKHECNGTTPLVTVVSIKSSPSRGSILLDIMKGLNMPCSSKPSHEKIPEVFRRVVNTINEKGVLMILFDEFHHCNFGNVARKQLALSEFVKDIVDACPNTRFVFFGVHGLDTFLDVNEQLNSRVLRYEFQRISWNKDGSEWRGFLMRVQCQADGALNGLEDIDIVKRLLVGTHGNLHILRDAISHACNFSDENAPLEQKFKDFFQQRVNFRVSSKQYSPACKHEPD